MNRPVTLGVIATVLLSMVGWLATPWTLDFGGRDNPVWIRAVHSTPAFVGVILLFVAWLRIQHADAREQWRAFIAWSIPLCLAPAIMSKDAWAYLEQGWIVATGMNPYETPLSTQGSVFGPYVDGYWQDTTTVYPPLALLIQGAIIAIVGDHPLAAMFMMRLPGILATVVIGWSLSRIARIINADESRALWMGLTNPLVVIHFVGGMHNDGWAVALALVGLVLAFKYRPWGWPLGCVLVGLAMATKQPLGLMAVAVAIGPIAQPDLGFRQAWRSQGAQVIGRLAAGVGITVGIFAAVSMLSGWGFGWATGSGMPSTTATQSLSHFIAAGYSTLAHTTFPPVYRVVGAVSLAIGAIVMVVLAARLIPHRPIGFTAWGMTTYVLAYPSLQAWYLLWGGVLFGLIDVGRRAWIIIIAVVAYELIVAVGLEYAGWPIQLSQLAGLAMALMVWNCRATIEPYQNQES